MMKAKRDDHWPWMEVVVVIGIPVERVAIVRNSGLRLKNLAGAGTGAGWW
jgi:hypothetical protein